MLGEESALFKRRELKALMSIHAEPEVGGGVPRAVVLHCSGRRGPG